ncbi:unnamed protein product [Linum tenue]|uniref:SWIM-type domain-containing protein n=1 Tax=Linum tenue TaxID=586396 RepID=A0AAV0MHQ1_9ROSI|nr:unnamed protein product [Linum tenue]
MCTSRPSSETMHEVSIDGKGFVVDLNNRKCTCSWWALNDIPCCHASITSMRRQSDLYVDGFFKMEFVKPAYKFPIPTSEGRQAWMPAFGNKVYPPRIRRMLGRPKKKRRREAWEIRSRQAKNGIGEVASRENLSVH